MSSGSERQTSAGPPPAPRRRLHEHTPAELKEVIAAERLGDPFLTWRTPEGEQRILLLGIDRWRIMIGRDPSADVSLAEDPEVSRAHALIERMGQGWTFVDDGLSRNGSYINGARVMGRRRLLDGDRIACGGSEITYREPVPARSDSTISSMRAVPALPMSPTQRKVLIALCRPVQASDAAIPATNRQIADEVHLSIDAVKGHLRVLFERYGLADYPQNEKRARLVATALMSGALTPRELAGDR